MKKRSGKAGLKTKQSSRRRWITFRRIVRYGVSNFFRNAWLSAASTLIMTVALMIVLVALVASKTLTSTVEVLRDTVEMSIYVKGDIDEGSIKTIKNDLENLGSVRGVQYISPGEAKQETAQQIGYDADTIKAFNYSKNVLPGTFRIQVEDINDPSELESFVAENKTYQKFDSGDPPSFSSERRIAIDRIAQVSKFIEKFGLLAIGVFLIIAILFVFNTIRMAIFNRKSEIYMMRLIGAEHSFIRGPFIIEAVMTGLFAGVISTIALYVILSLIDREQVLNYGIMIDKALDMMHANWPIILMGVCLLGSVVAIISSMLATRRYLKDQVE
ncbi:MAG: cell division protein FtsX [Candidatus Nanosyncoccaceae bacterium]|jgi:cell division transport system permease protein